MILGILIKSFFWWQQYSQKNLDIPCRRNRNLFKCQPIGRPPKSNNNNKTFRMSPQRHKHTLTYYINTTSEPHTGSAFFPQRFVYVFTSSFLVSKCLPGLSSIRYVGQALSRCDWYPNILRRAYAWLRYGAIYRIMFLLSMLSIKIFVPVVDDILLFKYNSNP